MFAENVPVSGDSIELDFMPPPEVHGEQIAMKVEVIDPMDRRFTAHLGTLATILPPKASETGGCEDTGSTFIGDPGCSGGATGEGPTSGPDGSSGPGSSSDGGGSGTTGPGAQPGSGDGGCGCRTAAGAPSALLVGLSLLVARRRRGRGRREDPHCPRGC